MASQPVILILGAGKRIGAQTAQRFAEGGYKVAVVSRQQGGDAGYTNIQADLSDVEAVQTVFEQVRKELGEPSVVVYNAFGLTPAPSEDPFSVSPTTFAQNLTVNTSSVYAAIHEALKSFPKTAQGSGTFIYTGNFLNTPAIVTPFTGLAVGKTASAKLIQTAAQVYGPKGYRFYYADERKADGSPKGPGVSAEAHAELYWKLTEAGEQGPWQATFVEGEGYKKF